MNETAEELEELRRAMDALAASIVVTIVLLPVIEARMYADQDPRIAVRHRRAEGIRV